MDLRFSSLESSDDLAKAEIKIKLIKADIHARLHIEKSTIQIKSTFLARNSNQIPISFKILDALSGDKGLSGSVLRFDRPTEQSAGSELTLALNYTFKKPARAATKSLSHRV